VISRDVADLVRQCLEDKAAHSSGGKRRPGNILDNLLQDEINKFTSVDFEDPGARPLSADELASGASGSDLIDPRGWAGETGSAPSALHRPTGSLPLDRSAPRALQKDTPVAVSQARALAPQAQKARAAAAPATAGASLSRPTPGPEALASVLEPEPETGLGAAAGAPTQGPARPARGIVVAVALGVLVLAIAAFAGIVASRH